MGVMYELCTFLVAWKRKPEDERRREEGRKKIHLSIFRSLGWGWMGIEQCKPVAKLDWENGKVGALPTLFPLLPLFCLYGVCFLSVRKDGERQTQESLQVLSKDLLLLTSQPASSFLSTCSICFSLIFIHRMCVSACACVCIIHLLTPESREKKEKKDQSDEQSVVDSTSTDNLRDHDGRTISRQVEWC